MARSNFREHLRRVRDRGRRSPAQRLAVALGVLLVGALVVLLVLQWVF